LKYVVRKAVSIAGLFLLTIYGAALLHAHNSIVLAPSVIAPLSRFDFGGLTALANAAAWQAKERTLV